MQKVNQTIALALTPKPKVWKVLKKVKKNWSHELKRVTSHYYANVSCQGKRRTENHVLQKQNRRQKVVKRGVLHLCGGALRSCRGGLTFKFEKTPLTYSVSYFNLGGLELCLGGISPPKPPRGDGMRKS